MPVNDKILYTDYNSIQNSIAELLGASVSGSRATFGYGQTVRSSAVSGANGAGSVLGGGSGANTIRTDEYSKLRSDIINIYRHVYGVDPTPADPGIGALIRWVTASTAVSSEYNISEFNIAEYNATSISGSSDPYTQFSIFVTDLQNNRFTCAASQAVTNAKGSVTRTAAWGGGNVTIACRVSVTWSSSAAARAFFNSGGEIRLNFSRTGGSVSNQNTSWSSILSAAGTRTFSAQLPGTTFGLTDASNYYNLTNVFQTIYTGTGSSPYGSNQFRLGARTAGGTVSNNNTGTATGVDFLCTFQDSYTDPDGATNIFAPADTVDGDLSISVTEKRASGVLEPSPGAGNFTVESPTVTFTGNSTNTPNTID